MTDISNAAVPAPAPTGRPLQGGGIPISDVPSAIRLGAVRVYEHRPVVVFKLTFPTSGRTSESFPSVSSYPPASHYMNAVLFLGPHGELVSGITADGGKIPPGFVAMSALVIAPGINRAFDIWGSFLTDLAGKRRPGNDADFSLKYLGYFTDQGARYYYRFVAALGYVDRVIRPCPTPV